MPLVSQSDFAALHGVSRKTATKWKEAGRLVFDDGKVDVAKSDALLRDAGLGRFKNGGAAAPEGNKVTAKGNKPVRQKAAPVASVARPAAAPKDDAADPAEDDGEAGPDEDLPDTKTIQRFLKDLLDGNYASQAEAERVKENALAGVRALELLVKAGALVEMEVAERALFEGARAVRDLWLNWPSRIGPMLAADIGLPPEKVVEALTKYVHEQLAEIGEPQADLGGEA